MDRSKVVPILIHGDAAFAGQGVVYETINLSQTRAYGTGGTVHIVVNNQIGFTSSNPDDSRSSTYCTDVGKVVEAPIFHVNGDDPEACVFVARLAIEYRMRFQRDVFIDMVCYRRHGHNEGDPPSATQPRMYRRIREKDSALIQYRHELVRSGVLSETAAEDLARVYRDRLDSGETVNDRILLGHRYPHTSDWSPHIDGH